MLNDCQRRFCELLVEGRSQTEAYMEAFPRCKSRNAASVSAPRLLGKASIRQEIKRLRGQLEVQGGLTRLRKREILYSIATDSSKPASERLKAIVLDNRMMGHDRAAEVDIGVDPIKEILQSLTMERGLPKRIPDSHAALEDAVEQ